MPAAAIWAVALAARRRLARLAPGAIDPAAIMRGSARLRANGRELRIAWDADHAVHDGGAPVLGVCENDPAEPGMVMISLNAEMLEGRPDLLRSTAAHELGHAIFDMPAAVGGRHTRIAERQRAAPMDWREWRADEFMGAFLVPPAAMRKALLPRASQAGLEFRWRNSGEAPIPVLACGPDGIELMADELAQVFGVSPAFIGVRLRKYGFVKQGESRWHSE